MHELTEIEVAGLAWSDANYYGYRWVQAAPEPTLIVLIEPCNSPLVELVGIWATQLKVELNYNNSVGPLLTWEVEFKQTENTLWEVHIDLAHQGQLSFECNKLFTRTASDNENA